MPELDISLMVTLTTILCFIFCIAPLWVNNHDKLFKLQLHGSGVVGFFTIVIGAFIGFKAATVDQGLSSIVLVLVGLFSLVGMVIKKNSSHESDVPTAYPVYMILIILVLMLCLWWSAYYLI